VGEEIAGQVDAAVAELPEFPLGPEQLVVGLDESGAITFEQFRWRNRSVEAGERRLVLEEIDVARRSSHEEKDDPFRGAGIVRILRGERIGRGCRRGGLPGTREEVIEGDASESNPAVTKEPAAGNGAMQIGESGAVKFHGCSLVRISRWFRRD
jgi:hypothetical protein